MKIVIIPSHNQSKNIERIVSGYENQTLKPDLVLFVLDRCSDNSLEILENINTELNLKWLVKETGENFSAGLTRDFGVEWVLENYPEYEMILFTDGDCVPSEKVVEKHFHNARQSRKAVLSCGMRKMETLSGEILEDERLDKNWVNGYTFTKTNGRLLVSNELTTNSIFTYSCNLAFNKKAIELCRSVNEKLNGVKRVFNSMFDGAWGGEDNLVSHILFRTGNYILMCDDESWVTHIYHEEYPKTNIEKRKRLVMDLSRKLSILILNGEIEGPVQKVYKKYVINFGGFDLLNDIKNVSHIKGLDVQIENCIDYICDKYGYSKIPVKYFLTNNVKVQYENGVGCSDFSLSAYKQFVGYLKFYLRNDDIEFYDDVKDFQRLEISKRFCDYCSLTSLT